MIPTEADSLPGRLAAADRLGADAVARTVEHAAVELSVDSSLAMRLAAAARAEAKLRHPAVLAPGSGADPDGSNFEFGLIEAPSPGKFDPKIVQLRLSPFIASICGALGSTLGALTPLGWALVGIGVGIALREFWKKTVTFDGLHGQILYEMYRATDDGAANAVRVDELFADVNASRALAAQAALARRDFDFALSMLLSSGILGMRTVDGMLEWAEATVELVP